MTLAMAAVAMGSCAPAAPKMMFTYSEIRGQLPGNGLRFVVMPDPTTSLVEVDVRYEVGSSEDPPGKAGLAHLAEHLMFEQQPGGPGTPALKRTLQQATLNMNAYTSWDATHFMLNARAALLDTLVKVEATRMHDGCRTIPEHEFLREREVVRNEIRTRRRRPEAMIEQLTLSAVYPPDHAYARWISGNDEQVSSITLRDVCDFMERYYVPERAVVVVAGGVPADRAVRSIENWFNRIDRRAPAPRRVVEPLAGRGARKTIELDLERPWVTIAWPLPDSRTREGEAVLFGINEAFRYAAYSTDRDECATHSRTDFLGGVEAPLFMLALELSSMSALDDCLDRVWKTARAAGYGWDNSLRTQLDEARNRRKAALLTRLEPLFGEGGRTDWTADQVQFSRDIDFRSRDMYVFHELDRIGKIEVVDVVAAMKRVLDRDRARVTVFAPRRGAATGDRRASVVFEAAMDKHEERALDPGEAHRPLDVPGALATSRAVRFQLDNGMRVVLLPVDGMPVAAVQLIFDAGEATAPDRPGLATAAAELLRLPPGTRTAWQAGMRLRCSATPDHTICTASGVSFYLNVMIHVLEGLIRAGGYSDDEVDRWQRVMRARYGHKRSVQELAFRHHQLAALYGPSHPYTRSGTMPEGSVDAIDERAMISFRNRHYTAANATLVIAGMFDLAQTEAQVREAFGYWNRGDKDAPVPAAAPRRTGPVHIGVLGADDAQVDVALLYPSPPGIAGGDHAARLVLASMLDDQMKRIRDDLGATYGVHARHEPRIGGSAVRIWGAVDAPRAGEALRAMRAGIDALRTTPDFDAMFARARRKIVQGLLNGSTISLELAERLTRTAQFGLRPTFDSDLLRSAAALSPTIIKQLISRELDPRGEIVVLLGDQPSITRAFNDAGITDAEIVQPTVPARD